MRAASVNASLTYSYDMFKGIVAISGCKSNHHWTSGVGNSHTVCRVGEDWPIQPQKATSVRLNQTTKRCYATKTLNRARSSNVGGPEHRQTTHEHMSNIHINGQARSQTQAHELSGSLTRCEDAQNRRRHPDRSRTKKSSVFLKRC